MMYRRLQLDTQRAMNILTLSNTFELRILTGTDIPELLSLCLANPQYYRYCPPAPDEKSLYADMHALPPHKTADDKYYIGYFDHGELIAVLDLITAYPDQDTAFIGFFMMKKSRQGRNEGSAIIRELCVNLQKEGFKHVRLGWVQGNPQAEHFWHKNGFQETGVIAKTERYDIVIAQKELL